MSNIIPMVSSSPPPLDDTGGFDDWGDDDDFGGFIAAEQTTNTWVANDSKTLDEVNANINHIDNNFSNDIKMGNCRDRISPLSLTINKPLINDISKESSNCNTDCDTNVSSSKASDTMSGNSTGDSGLFDVSPTPEDTKCDTSPTPISEDTNTENSEQSMETFQNTPDDIPVSTIENIGVEFSGNINDIQYTRSKDDKIPCVEMENASNFTEQSITETFKENHSDEVDNSNLCSPNTFISQTEQLSSHIDNKNGDDLKSSHTDKIQENTEHSNFDHSGNDKEVIQTYTEVSDNSSTKGITDDELNHHSTQNPSEINGKEKLDADFGDGNKDSAQEIKSIPKTEKDLPFRNFSKNEGNESVNEKPLNEDSALPLTNLSAIDKSESEQSFQETNIVEHMTKEDDLNSQEHEKDDDLRNDLNSQDHKIDDSNSQDHKIDDDLNSQDHEKDNDFNSQDHEKIVYTENDGDDFADFSSAVKCNGTTESVVKSGNNENSSETMQSSLNDNTGDDDFANFSSAPISDCTESSLRSSNDLDDKNSSETVQSSSNDATGDDDFANFSSTPICNSDEAPLHSEEGGSENCSKLSIQHENDNFSQFSASGITNKETEDFGNFSSQENFENGESDDDFADFSSATVKDDDFGTFGTVSVNDGDDGFADFSSAPIKDNNITDSSRNSADNDSSNDDWAAFEQTDKEVECKSETSLPPKQTNFSRMVEGCFKDSIELSQDTEDIDLTLEHKESHLWIKVQEVDNTGLIKWTQCSCNRNLFVSLKIDTKNILLGHKKPAVPIYAAHLTLLEPTKGAPNLLQPEVTTLVDTNKQEEVKDLPPVQFDWTSSGLKNPLEENSKLQNLDFLTVNESELIAKTKAFDADLIHGHKPAMQPLQNILANLKATKKTRLEDLSNEAGRVISHLPNLSFMKSKVLMFPLKDNNL